MSSIYKFWVDDGGTGFVMEIRMNDKNMHDKNQGFSGISWWIYEDGVFLDCFCDEDMKLWRYEDSVL